MSEVRIDLEALAHNFSVAREAASGADVIAVLKADAYGHGAVPAARCLLERGCRKLAVLSLSEAQALRDAGIDAPILFLAGPQSSDEAQAAVGAGLTPVLHHLDQLEWMTRAARPAPSRVPVQVEVDTGMRRMGVAPEQAAAFFMTLLAQDELKLEGVFTHLARADEALPGPSLEQIDAFEAILRRLPAPPPEHHVHNSAGLLHVAAKTLPLVGNAVRPGLMLYGVSPAAHFDAGLRPVMSLRAPVVAVRRLRAGDGVGYGGTWRAPRAGLLATLRAGYADGVPWTLSGRGSALLAGRRRPVVGRVSMDYSTLWVDEGSVEIGSSATIFGSDGALTLSVEEVATEARTSRYEVVTRVGSRVPRRYSS